MLWTILYWLGVWCAVSVVASLLVGRFFGNLGDR